MMTDHLPPVPDPSREPQPVEIPISSLPPENLAEQAVERAAEKVAHTVDITKGHRHPISVGLLIANIVLVGALFFVRAGDQREIRRAIRVVYDGTACLLADLDDHRHTNQTAHENLAEAEGAKVTQPDITPLNKEQANILKHLCDEFIKAGTQSLVGGLGKNDPNTAQGGKR